MRKQGRAATSEAKLKEAIARLNELRYRLEPVEQHWGWSAEQLHHELRHVLHTLNGLVTYLRSDRGEAVVDRLEPQRHKGHKEKPDEGVSADDADER
jgi:hypothetical protein